MRLALPFDGSPSAHHALDYVIDLAKSATPGSVEVRVINAQDATVRVNELFGHDAADVASRLAQSSLEAGTKLLVEPLKALKSYKVPTESAVLLGDPADVIAAYVDDHGCDAVVMGTRGLGQVAGLVMGSVASKVIHLVKVPVTLVK